MSITHYRVLARTPGEPASVLVELSFDGAGYCYGLDADGERLWRETDAWSINVPEGEEEGAIILAHIAQWESESHKPHPQAADEAPTPVAQAGS